MTIVDVRGDFKFSRAARPETVGIIIHHTAGGEGGLIPSIQNTGNGYHYAIRPNGDILYLLTDNLQAWHAGRTTQPRFAQTKLPQVNPNNTTIGVAFIGNFANSLPTPQALAACDDLVGMLKNKYTTLQHVYGHVSVTATACPGQIDWTRWQDIVSNTGLGKKKESEAEEMRYNTIGEIPDWGKATIQKLIDKGLFADADRLDLTMDMLRLLIVNDRAGLYDR